MSDPRPLGTYRLDCSHSSTVAICGHCAQRFLSTRPAEAAADLMRHQQAAHTDRRVSTGLLRRAGR